MGVPKQGLSEIKVEPTVKATGDSGIKSVRFCGLTELPDETAEVASGIKYKFTEEVRFGVPGLRIYTNFKSVWVPIYNVRSVK